MTQRAMFIVIFFGYSLLEMPEFESVLPAQRFKQNMYLLNFPGQKSSTALKKGHGFARIVRIYTDYICVPFFILRGATRRMENFSEKVELLSGPPRFIEKIRKYGEKKEQVALCIDFENIAISAEEAYGRCDIDKIVRVVDSYDRCIIKQAYGDWTRFNRQELLEQAIDLTQLFRYGNYTKKNSADIVMAVDVIEAALTNPA